MARPEKLLTARAVMAAAKPGMYPDGGGLYLAVDGAGDKGLRKRWVWRYRLGDKRRDMGLGSASEVGLAEARAERDRWRAVLRQGQDPIEMRADERAGEKGPPLTFSAAADGYIAAHEGSWRNAKHRAQWRMTLDVYAKPLAGKPVASIATADILAVLKPIWLAKPETAARLRGRIEMVLDAARALGHIEEGRANPARWKGHLDKLLPKRARGSRGNFAAMPWREVPAFVADLRAEDSVAARALEFTILTAARTGEVIGATREEIDVAAKVWTVPGERMKSGRQHRVPLCDRALSIAVEVTATQERLCVPRPPAEAPALEYGYGDVAAPRRP